MSNFVNALKTFTNTQVGEKGHAEKAWSFDIDEKITQFFFQLVRCKDHSDLERHLHDILSTLTHAMRTSPTQEAIDRLTLMYKLIGQTRDIVAGKGEQQLTFMQIFIWYQYVPELAMNSLVHLVKMQHGLHPYGSWKDMKYFAKYVKDKTSDSYHPLIMHACKLLSSQLKEDWEFCTDYFVKAKDPEMKNDNVNLSLASRWCPREPNYKQKKNIKFGFMYQTIADIMFPHFLASTSPDNKESWKRAKTKCRIHLKKRITIMNKHLDTTQIKQCNGEWSKINFNTVTTQTTRRQKRAFQNLTKRGEARSESDDRKQCAANFKNHIEAAKVDPTRHKVHGKRCNTYELVKDALQHTFKTPQNQTDIDTLNLQWEDNRKNNKGLEKIPMVAMVDTSGSMECDECIPLNNAIGLGIRVSELTHPAFRNMVLTFDHTPQWISLEDCGDFHSKVWKLKRAAWGTSTRIYLAFKMILDACLENKVPPKEVEGMVLAIFSDMQIDCGWVNDCPYGNNELASEIETMYNRYGYQAPHLLFWNLRKTTGFPVLSSKNNCTALSGYSSTLLNVFCDKGIEALKEFTPRKMLEDLLANPRYAVMEEDIITHYN